MLSFTHGIMSFPWRMHPILEGHRLYAELQTPTTMAEGFVPFDFGNLICEPWKTPELTEAGLIPSSKHLQLRGNQILCSTYLILLKQSGSKFHLRSADGQKFFPEHNLRGHLTLVTTMHRKPWVLPSRWWDPPYKSCWRGWSHSPSSLVGNKWSSWTMAYLKSLLRPWQRMYYHYHEYCDTTA